MVSRPVRSASICWQPTKCFVLFAALMMALPEVAIAQSQTGQQGLPFGLSSLFGTTAQSGNRRTRIAIDLRRKSKYDVFSLNNPNRVIIELPQTGMRLPRLRHSTSNGLVKNLRAGHSAPGRSRIVIDVTEPVIIEDKKIVQTNKGARLELVLIPFKSMSPRTKAALKRPTYSLGAVPTMPRRVRGGRGQDAYKPLIVIDPGHGGKDSGARKFGVNEKDVVLAFGRTLRNHLAKTKRYRVAMTRSTDVFIPLGDRRSFAEKMNAALFIAVHADYAGSSARGATIYSLRSEMARRLRAAAAADAARNALSGGVMQNVAARSGDLKAVRGILGDLAQREVHANLERTNVFTKFAIAQMGATTTMRSKPHRQAAFKVLKTAKVPSVLIELAYVTNRRDSARLQSQQWRDEVSGSLVEAIDKYFAHSLAQIAH